MPVRARARAVGKSAAGITKVLECDWNRTVNASNGGDGLQRLDGLRCFYKVLSAGTKTAMSQARSARSIFLFGLLSLVQADSLGQLTVCIVEAYNLENLDANEAFGGTASDP